VIGLATLLLPAAFADTLPPGSVIDEALSARVSEDALDSLGVLVPQFIPSDIPVDDISESVDLFICEPGIWMSNIQVDVAFGWVDITTVPGEIQLAAGLDVSINSPSNPFGLDLDYCLGDTSCPGYVDPFEVVINTSLGLEIIEDADGNKILDATLGALDYDLGLSPSDDLHLDCGIQTLEEVLGYLGISIYDFIFDLAIGTLDDSIGDLTADLEPTIEEAFAAATISEQVEILDGVVLDLELFPSDLIIDDNGLQLIMGGSADAPASECVASYDPGGSLLTESFTPEPTGDGAIEAALSDEFANQALYALWRSGILCYEIADLQGLTLDTSLLGLLAGDAFDELFPESSPIAMVTRPGAPPTAVYDGDNDIGVAVEALGLDIYADLDGRSTRILNLDLALEAGVDLEFDGATGDLGIGINLDADSFAVAVGHNEYAPDAGDDIAGNFAGVFDSLVGPLLDGLLGDSLAFTLPAFEGLGLTSIDVSPAGEYNDWLGLNAYVGLVPYESGGCDEEGNCDTGCEGGCASSSGRSRLAMLFFPIFLALVRRRG